MDFIFERTFFFVFMLDDLIYVIPCTNNEQWLQEEIHLIPVSMHGTTNPSPSETV